MRTVDRQAQEKLWGKLWDNLEDEWFKIETQQDYSGEDDGSSLKAWKRGDKEEAKRLIKSEPWVDEWIEACQKQPAKKTRIHVVKEPYTPYLEWEIEVYKQVNIPLCGEQVYLVQYDQVIDLNIPDFMIFDNQVLVNYYDKSGTLTHSVHYDDIDDISQFLKFKSELLKHTAPIQ